MERAAVTITADIEDLAVADFMMVLTQNQKTGQLTIENGEERLKLAFRNGDIVYASSTGVRETVGAMLVRRGLVSEEQLEAALQLQKKQEGAALLGQILVEMDAVTAADLTGVVYLQFQNVIREAMAWNQGVGTFEPMDIPDLGEVRVDPREVILETGIRTEQILLSGAAVHDEANREGGSPDYFKAVRDVLANLKEESLVVTSEMAATILKDANKLVRRAILFLVYPNALSVVGGFDSDDREASLAMAGRRIERLDGEESAISWVIDEGRSYRGRLKEGDGNRPLKELLGDQIPKEVIVIPVIVDRKVAGVLYGDNGSEDSAIGNIGDLERVVARVAREMGKKRHA
jgi:hypothetical protein